ncbi:MAG: cell division protein FtsK [Chloroflexi bacterium AL-W]|nr:cell division protein FtsK [Chloroflexi bacterium AL-N1]NOK69801.1 cell division protein FtsK [Chloroflexi bacterium AL-N10]NOK73595.1 cell division protein FtsK [Chloroflexi bacterium AL-N5]NOK83971.1 cell division protein FtsK [Chloroflexi bacterium AL-W]NOK87926.1 cell division protein FtsK [Chloroflexi bacterium AL-N15]
MTMNPTTREAPSRNGASPQQRVQTFNRPPRIRPSWSVEEIRLPEPPRPNRHDMMNWLIILAPLFGVMVMIGAMALISNRPNSWMFAIPMGAMSVVGVITSVMTYRTRKRQNKEEFEDRQAFFEEQLQQRHDQIRQQYDHERACRLYLDPHPTELLYYAGRFGHAPQARLWERRLGDTDFLALRLGLGQVTCSTTVVVPEARDAPIDRRLPDIHQRYAMLQQVPITLPFAEMGSLGIAGPRPVRQALVRALIWQAVVLHTPQDLRLAVFPAPADAPDMWDWLRWLPHTIALTNDPAHHLRMCASDATAVAHLMSALLDELSQRRDALDQQKNQATGTKPQFPGVLVIVDGSARVRDQPVMREIMQRGAQVQMALICLEDRWEHIPTDCGGMVEIQRDGRVRWMRAGAAWSPEHVVCDQVDVQDSDVLARQLAGIQLDETGGNQDVPQNVRLFDVLDIADERDLMPPRFWQEPLEGAWRPDVPLGLKAGSEPLYIDLYEHRHGSHGIIAGTTGAGKSVLLQTMIAALVITHTPLQMQLLLIDFKGGASLEMFTPLPHTVGLVTDLEGRLAERAMTAIKSEIRRRKTILRTMAQAYTKVENIHDYRALARVHHLPPLPNLMIVIDEFDEMVKTYREFVAELVRVVKQGRSLGVHLLVATQQPAQAVSDEIRTQLKFFIALRLGSSEDSREMLLKPDAAFLPTTVPGRAYFRSGSEFALFQVAQVTGAYRPRGAQHPAQVPRVTLHVNGETRTVDPTRANHADATGTKKTDLEVLVTALQQAGGKCLAEAARAYGWQPQPIWQPPLSTHLTLAEVLDLHRDVVLEDLLTDAWQGPVGDHQRLEVVLGRLDIPQQSRQIPLRINLNDGHLAIIGSPGSGKTNLLRTLVLSLALTYSPQEVWCYAIDAGGQGLSLLDRLPHVGSVIQVRDRERVRRLLSVLQMAIRERQDRFRDAGVSDLATYQHEQGERLPALVVVIDKFALVREEFTNRYGEDTLVDELVRLARTGRAYGIHLIITADSPRDLTHKLLTLVETRMALWLPEMSNYSEVLGARVQSQIAATTPGRGLCTLPELGVLDAQMALPLLEHPTDETAAVGAQATILDSEIHADLKEVVARIHAHWIAQSASVTVPAIELLPDQLTLADLGDTPKPLPSRQMGLQLHLGKESVYLGVATLQLNRDTPHALVVGGRRSGKTTTLQTCIHSLTQAYSPDEVRLVLIDSHKGGLRAFKDLPHCAGFAAHEPEIQTVTQLLLQQGTESAAATRWVIVVDDFHIGRSTMKSQFTQQYSGEPNLFSVLSHLALVGGERGIHLLLATNPIFMDEGVLKVLDEGRNGLILWPQRYEAATRLLGLSLPMGERGTEQPPGRAVLVHEDEQLLVQVARSTHGINNGAPRA